MMPMVELQPMLTPLPLFHPEEDEADPYLDEDQEKENSELIEKLPPQEEFIFNEAFERLKAEHPFNEFYKNSKIQYNFAKTVRALMDNYTHVKALKFIAKTEVWNMRNDELPLRPVVPRNEMKAVKQFCWVDSIHALYRVISIKVDKYIVVACHMNIHAFDRGDLRFLEINHRTKTNASEYSCIGHLAHGDIVAVTGLIKIRKDEDSIPNVYHVTQETPCTWMVSEMTLLKRIQFSKIPFSFLENGTAVALQWGQVLTVQNSDKYTNKNEFIFLGNGFIPEKVHDFASGLNPDQRMQLAGLTREITRYPPSNGTIFTHVRSPHYTEYLKVGFDAYHTAHPDPDGVVELCALMGATGVAAVSAEPIHYVFNYFFPAENAIRLNQYQNEYVQRLLQNAPITLANSPFGCGKSMTIATAAFYAVLKSRRLRNNHQQLIVTQSNFASCNLVDITKKYTDKCKVIRYVSESNWLELPEEGRTDLDLPLLMQTEFIDYVMGTKYTNGHIHLNQMAIYLKEKNILQVEEMGQSCRRFFYENPDARKYNFSMLTKSFFALFQPEIVITTADSLRGVLSCLNDIDTVQFDEASQVPECALIQILATFPRVCFGLVGDIKQLPPFSDHLLTKHLVCYGIGKTMERAINLNLFPQVVLKTVYRCHPVTTLILGNEFYGNRLVSGVTIGSREELMTNRPDFWPNSKFPIMIYNNNHPSEKMGTSYFNRGEVLIVRELVYRLTSPTFNYTIHPRDIGIISFYKAQVSYLCEQFRSLDVKCGTVDSFQGMEREVMIVCLTNEVINGFLVDPHRCNVAMSRAKQTTIIIGNVRGLGTAKHWKTFVKFAQENDCIKEL
ncbi:hypothetical protein CAEBREN_29461 [Caenorhabditis brenneri]|uniref:DNA2/NAM7 helicase-like C-terminal domain-containing protein n=1 Tax=Caenorhabditis brenneri TaxID=135651 RepID=G0PI48_CAEBE|nr:hypothetical protein CAEBREN_29461 [Caenorhabditis brenneri]